MHTVFVPDTEARHVIKYCAAVYFQLEKEALGSQFVVAVKTFADVLKVIEKDQNKSSDDTYDVIGLVPTAAEVDAFETIVESAYTNLILAGHQITPEIENSEVLAEKYDVGLLERVWMFYMICDTPAFIAEMDKALEGKGGDMLGILHKLASLRKSTVHDVIENAVETNGASLKSL